MSSISRIGARNVPAQRASNNNGRIEAEREGLERGEERGREGEREKWRRDAATYLSYIYKCGGEASRPMGGFVSGC
jgi:hypothetical protein